MLGIGSSRAQSPLSPASGAVTSRGRYAEEPVRVRGNTTRIRRVEDVPQAEEARPPHPGPLPRIAFSQVGRSIRGRGGLRAMAFAREVLCGV